MTRISTEGIARGCQGARFGTYDVDLRVGELRKGGIRLKLQDQPFKVLSVLVGRPGEVVTREELRQILWADNSYVDFENSLNSAVSRLRDALNDSASAPRYVETLPRRGYRFVAPVEFYGEPEAITSAPAPVLPADVPRRHPRVQWMAAAALAVLVAMVILLILVRRNAVPAAYEATVLTSYLGDEHSPSFHPSGNEVAFSWNGETQDNYDIYRKVIGPGEVLLRLTSDPAPEYHPAWSPDGRWIAFLRSEPANRAKVVLMPALGGAERIVSTIQPFDSGPLHRPSRALAWTLVSSSLIVSDREGDLDAPGLFLLAIDTGEKHRLTAGQDLGPALSPDGKSLAFSRATGRLASDIYVVAMGADRRVSGSPRRVSGDVREATSPVWTGDGKEIIFAGVRDGNGTLWRVQVDGGNPQPLGTGDGAAYPAIAPGVSRLAYSRQQSRQWNIWRLDLRSGRNERFVPISSTAGESAPRYSPDGGRIAFSSSRSGRPQIWVSNSDGTQLMQLTFFEQGLAGSPRWSPDGKWIAFDSTVEGRADVFVMSAEGGEPTRLTNHPAADLLPSWSHDGRWVYFCSERSGSREIWKVAPTGGEAVPVTTRGGFASQESADGGTLYYLKGTNPTFSLWSMPVEGGDETLVLPSVQRRSFEVTAQGLYFMAATEQGRTSLRYRDFRTAQTREVATVDDEIALGFGVAPDAQTLLYSRRVRPEADLMLVEKLR